MEFIVTFGCGQILRNKFARVEAPSEWQARDLVFATYGDCWAFLYNSEWEAGVEEWRMTEVPFGTPNGKL